MHLIKNLIALEKLTNLMQFFFFLFFNSQFMKVTVLLLKFFVGLQNWVKNTKKIKIHDLSVLSKSIKFIIYLSGRLW